MRLGLLDHRAESSSLSSCQALRRWRWLCRRLAGPPPCLPCVAALHVSSPLSGRRRGSICCCRLAASVVAARRSGAALLLACCCCRALLPGCSLLVLAWLVPVAVLGVAFLPRAGACGVVVVCRAALRRLPFAALAGWLGCWAGLVARSCSRCLTSWSLGLAAAAAFAAWPAASCGEAADATTRVASAAGCRLEMPVVAEDRPPCVCSGVVVVERCWQSRSALIPLFLFYSSGCAGLASGCRAPVALRWRCCWVCALLRGCPLLGQPLLLACILPGGGLPLSRSRASSRFSVVGLSLDAVLPRCVECCALLLGCSGLSWLA